MPSVMLIHGLINGPPTPFDGEYLVEYDPDRPSLSPDGHPMIAHIRTTPDPAQARVFASGSEAMECWRQQSTRDPVRPDGRPNRPLTAFTVEIKPQ